MNEIIKLRDVLINSEEFEWSDALFMVKDENWTVDSKCAILDPDDVEDDADEEPKFAMDNNMKYVLSMQDIQSIVDNAHQQHVGCTENELYQAFLYYYDNDAFIIFDDK